MATKKQRATALLALLSRGPSIFFGQPFGPMAQNDTKNADIEAHYKDRYRLWHDTWVKDQLAELLKDILK